MTQELNALSVSPPNEVPKPLKGTAADMEKAQSVADIMELRRQETRRRVTYSVVGAFCLMAGYLIFYGPPELQAAAFSGLLGIAGSIIGFYFGGKQGDA